MFLEERPCLNDAQRRALWAIQYCRTATMGGHLHACEDCDTKEFRFHSCNHRSCPQCGKADTKEWVRRQLNQRVGAPYFMVTFTLPAELRSLFFTPTAKEIHQIFFEAAAHALRVSMAHHRSLGPGTTGFTLVLHTWNQRLLFHPHLHAIVPGAGIDRHDRVVTVKSSTFLAPRMVAQRAFRKRFKKRLNQLAGTVALPPVDPRVWHCDWGVKFLDFGDGQNAIKYLGAYVCRTAIGDSRILSITDTHVSFSWKDRKHGGIQKTETVEGVEFLRRCLRHVLPRGLKAVRHFGFCHPAAKVRRQRIAFHTGITLQMATGDPVSTRPDKPAGLPLCPCCGEPMKRVLHLRPNWKQKRGPPPPVIPSLAA
jgi:hypothetical protein